MTTFDDHTSWSKAVSRSHALMAALYAATDRADLMTSEIHALAERMRHFAWDRSAA